MSADPRRPLAALSEEDLSAALLQVLPARSRKGGPLDMWGVWCDGILLVRWDTREAALADAAHRFRRSLPPVRPPDAAPPAAAAGAPPRAADPGTGPLCCDLHNAHCEPPSELCCSECTEANHPRHPRGVPCTWADPRFVRVTPSGEVVPLGALDPACPDPAGGQTTRAAQREGRPGSASSGVGGPPVPPAPDRTAGERAGSAGHPPAHQPPADPAHGSSTDPCPARAGTVPLTAATSSGQGRLARTAGGESSASPPVPHDPDRTIGDYWAAEPDPQVPLRHVFGAILVGALLLALIAVVGVELVRLIWQVLR